VNINSQETEGIDFAAYQSFDLSNSTLTLGLDYTHLLKLDKTVLGADGLTFETQEFAGEYEYPEDRAALTGDYRLGDWGATARVNYISSFKDFRNLSPGALVDVRSVSSYTTVNFQVSYEGITNTRIALSVDNAFDESVPFAIGDSDTDLYGYVASVHNPRGRFWTLRTTYSFE
jgi:iron complex outermembrane recepter protein